MSKVPNKKMVSTSAVLFSLLGFLTLEDRADRLSQDTGKELPLYAV
jgi:hypothetical protein